MSEIPPEMPADEVIAFVKLLHEYNIEIIPAGVVAVFAWDFPVFVTSNLHFSAANNASFREHKIRANS